MSNPATIKDLSLMVNEMAKMKQGSKDKTFTIGKCENGEGPKRALQIYALARRQGLEPIIPPATLAKINADPILSQWKTECDDVSKDKAGFDKWLAKVTKDHPDAKATVASTATAPAAKDAASATPGNTATSGTAAVTPAAGTPDAAATSFTISGAAPAAPATPVAGSTKHHGPGLT